MHHFIKQEHARFLGSMFVTVLASQATMVVDAAVGGSLLGADAVSAVDLVVPVYEFFYALVMLLGMGGCTVASMCLGRGDVPAVRRHFTAAVAASAALMALMGALILLFPGTLVRLLCGGSDLGTLTHDYLVAMVPFFVVAGVSVISMMFTAMAGRPVLVMCCAVAQFVLNVTCNLLLLKVAHLGIEALAYSSAFASAATLLLLLPFCLRRDCPFRPVRCGARQFFSALGANVKYGSGFVAVNLAYVVMVYAMNTLSLRFTGEQGLFLWSVVLMIYLAGDYASAAAQETTLSLGGRLLGAGDRSGARMVCNRSLLFVLAWISLILAAVFFVPRLALPLFGAADVAVYPQLLRAVAAALPFIVGVSLGNLWLVRLVQRGAIVRYLVVSSLLYLSVPAVFLLYHVLQ